ncbi:DUF418 domain-containing protein [Deinococcus cavernae]|nr:DUF418 domain-containing protein [Deinococcus cavernae]
MTVPATPSAPESAGPVRDRSPLPDVLRGLALAGILIVNMQDFAGFRVWRQSGLDGIAQTLTDVLANGRFISIFAMLFGWGAAGLLARHGAGLFVKRHLILLLIGSLHFVLVWHGDIISNYALLGLSLLLFGSLGVRALLGVAGVSGGWWLVEKSLDAARSFAYQPLPRSANLPDLAPGITYPQVLSERAREFLPDLLGGSLYNGFWLLALFCLGAAAYQTGLLTRPQQHVPLLRRLAVWGTLAGGILGVWLAYLNTRADFASALLGIPVRMGGGLAGALGYVGIIGLLTVQGRLGWLKQFANSGRIAMSNYLAQSLVMTTLFYPYAGAQWSKWGAASTLALALAFSAGQVWLSGLIVQRYGSGPMEKLVRRLVYGSRGENHA